MEKRRRKITPKNWETVNGPRIPKNSKLTGWIREPTATRIFLKSISDFKRKKKRHKWISLTPVVFTGKSKQKLEVIVNQLEELRLSLALTPSIFYRMVSEFILIPNGRKYYPLKIIFSGSDNFIAEEFITRIEDTLPWIGDLALQDFGNDSAVKKVMEFSRELHKRKVNCNGVTFKSKDWFCVCSIKDTIPKIKNWSAGELLDRLEKFYKRRTKKVTVEMALADLTNTELDDVDLTQPIKVKKKKDASNFREILDTDKWLNA